MGKKTISIGRWLITNEGIYTEKENGAIYDFDRSDVWLYKKREEFLIYSLPVDVCSMGWLSNVDVLDFNSAFLVCMELFEDDKPKDFPKVSWSETLRRQYKRFNHSIDVNSYIGREKVEAKQKEKFDPAEALKKSLIDTSEKVEESGYEIVGDKLSRIP